MRLGSRPADRTRHVRAAFRLVRTAEEEAERAAQIAQLPTVEWPGRDGEPRTLYTIRCHGTTGNGPHLVNVEEWVLWALIDLRAFRCPHHS